MRRALPFGRHAACFGVLFVNAEKDERAETFDWAFWLVNAYLALPVYPVVYTRSYRNKLYAR